MKTLINLIRVGGLLLLASCLLFGAASCKTKSAEPEKEGIRLTTRPAKSLPGKVMQKAVSVECQSNIQQIRAALQTYHEENEAFPASLAEIGYPAKVLRCPISKEAYIYDPATGEIHCTFPGHEKY